MADQHVVRRQDGSWAVRGAGNQRDTSRHATQGDAIEAAKPIAQHQNSGVVIHRPDGRIRDIDSYGNESSAHDTKH
jgi:uncharacterized protein YdaT